TYDGLAIARAVAEHIHNNPRLGCKTLFATHYHELTQLADMLPRTFNYNVVVSEDKGQVVFLRNIAPGGADRSYGVHVARIAGMPSGVVSRAWEVLAELENGSKAKGESSRRKGGVQVQQMPLLTFASPVVDELLAIDVASMTPLDAINRLYELQERAREYQ
ncbi:MAG: DNA mismatch repair protein MutS, partial [Chloroflexi bacterium]|nr:DNA mismatch repair protein MutS [Chloroflexota bacterium]